MISFYGSQIVAYQASDGSVYCVDCWRTPGDSEADNKLERDSAIIRYDAESYFEDVVWCDDCGKEIVEHPDEDPEPDEADYIEAESFYQEGEQW